VLPTVRPALLSRKINQSLMVGWHKTPSTVKEVLCFSFSSNWVSLWPVVQDVVCALYSQISEGWVFPPGVQLHPITEIALSDQSRAPETQVMATLWIDLCPKVPRP
jgi:hypothetical protein